MALKWNDAEVFRLLHEASGPTGRYLATVGALIETAAKGSCPVKTGRLRSSIAWRLETIGGEQMCVVGTNVEYALFVHDGTKNADGSVRMKARPFLLRGMHDVLGRGP